MTLLDRIDKCLVPLQPWETLVIGLIVGACLAMAVSTSLWFPTTHRCIDVMTACVERCP